ncbi:MAG TPA: LptF/LptG family permease [Fimbriimonadaceae bacterium]|nr:LptF/LptG family permease [Fimbriimonadaceae bacterium]
MKRLDALVIKELVGPWVFGVAMFTALMMAATYLGRIAGYVVQGVGTEKIIQMTFLLLPAIIVQTFAMALLLGALLAFGRLSGDSEITAIRAAGVSLYRIILPVSAFSLIVAAFTFYLNEQVVPRAAREAETMAIDIASHGQFKNAQPVAQAQVENGRLVAFFGAQSVDLGTRTMHHVVVVSYDQSGQPSYALTADELEFTTLKQWRIVGGAHLQSLDPRGTISMSLDNGAWPQEIPALSATPQDLLAEMTVNPDVWSMEETRQVIEKGLKTGDLTLDQIRDYEYKYWNKIALPLAAFIFGTLGAALGIRNARTGAATGFAVSVIIIFAYFTLATFMNVFAKGGFFPSYVASFTPVAIGLIASGVIIWRRNR